MNFEVIIEEMKQAYEADVQKKTNERTAVLYHALELATKTNCELQEENARLRSAR